MLAGHSMIQYILGAHAREPNLPGLMTATHIANRTVTISRLPGWNIDAAVGTSPVRVVPDYPILEYCVDDSPRVADKMTQGWTLLPTVTRAT